MVHGIARDNSAWIKASAIRHQSRWFTDNPPVGLQSTHDAALIDLDVTLETPAKAKAFLQEVLQRYATEARVGGIGNIVSPSAMDRLVIAAGGVPRDFLLLCAASIQVARERSGAKQTGVQDVNEAAGRAAATKLQELEDDAASSLGSAAARRNALTVIRNFLIEESQFTYFKIDFRDKELHPAEYSLLQSIMDLRLLHLLSSSISDEHRAGRRFEVYTLDLSQFSGSRLKYDLRALDLDNGVLVLKTTGTNEPPKRGDTSKRLLGILRRGPLFDLARLSPCLSFVADGS
jgi:hypothetical protein